MNLFFPSWWYACLLACCAVEFRSVNPTTSTLQYSCLWDSALPMGPSTSILLLLPWWWWWLGLAWVIKKFDCLFFPSWWYACMLCCAVEYLAFINPTCDTIPVLLAFIYGIYISQPPLVHSWVLRAGSSKNSWMLAFITSTTSCQLTGTSPGPSRQCRGIHHSLVDDGDLSPTVTGDRFRYSLWP